MFLKDKEGRAGRGGDLGAETRTPSGRRLTWEPGGGESRGEGAARAEALGQVQGGGV